MPRLDTQAAAAASAKQRLLNSGGGDLGIKGRDGKIRSKTRSAAPIRYRRATRNIDGKA